MYNYQFDSITIGKNTLDLVEISKRQPSSILPIYTLPGQKYLHTSLSYVHLILKWVYS